MSTKSRRASMGEQQTRRKPAARTARAPVPLLELVIEEFLYACQQRLAEDTLRSYRGVLRIFSAYLKAQLGRSPTLTDFTLPVVQRWAMGLQQRPKWERGGLALGEQPVALETRRTYLRTLRTFSNWLPKPPHTFCAESPLRHLLLPRTSDTFKLCNRPPSLMPLVRYAA